MPKVEGKLSGTVLLIILEITPTVATVWHLSTMQQLQLHKGRGTSLLISLLITGLTSYIELFINICGK